MTRDYSVNVIIPVKNEERGLQKILPQLLNLFTAEEIIVVNDGSSDNTLGVAKEFGVRVVNHSYSMGNGAAIKSGARASKADVLVFMDGDGQHNPEDVSSLLARYDQGVDMVVAAREKKSHAGAFRWGANWLYNKFASWMVGRKIPDLTSGFRVVNASKFKEFIYMLPNGFSYPTTITMAFFRTGYSVWYERCDVESRIGKSHISVVKDGIKFFLIIFKVGVLYSPIKIFAPVSLVLFSVGISYYGYTYINEDRFTNMSALLLTMGVVVFLMGLLSEQINNLLYALMNKKEKDE